MAPRAGCKVVGAGALLILSLLAPGNCTLPAVPMDQFNAKLPEQHTPEVMAPRQTNEAHTDPSLIANALSDIVSKRSVAAPAQFHSGSKVAIITVFTAAYAGLTNNLLCSANALELPVIAVSLEMDGCQKIVEGVKSSCLELNWIQAEKAADTQLAATSNSSMPGSGGEYGSQGFRQVAQSKPLIVESVRRLGYHVLFLDSDIVLRHNPLEEMGSILKSVGPKNMLVQQETQPKAEDNGINSGLYLLLNVEGSADIMSAWLESIKEKPEMGAGDQVHLGKVYSALADRDGKVAILPVSKFPNGLAFFDPEGASERAGEDPVLVHNNFIAGIEPKELRLQETGMWFLSADKDKCGSQLHDIRKRLDKKPSAAPPAALQY